MTPDDEGARIPNLDNTLMFNCRLWMSEDYREMQISYQPLSNEFKSPVGDWATASLNRAYWRFGSGEDAFYIYKAGYKAVKPGDVPSSLDDYVPIGGEMLKCAIANWVLGMELSGIQHVMIRELMCNAAASVRLAPKPTLYNGLYRIRREGGPTISLQVSHVGDDWNIERFKKDD